MSSSSKKPISGRLVAFDQATIHTGWSCFDGTDLIGFGLLAVSDDNTGPDTRLDEMFTMIREVIERYNPSTVIFEGVMFQRSPAALIQLSNVQGMLRAICFLQNRTYKIYAPTAWRRLVEIKQGPGIKREDLKRQAVAYVHESYGIDVEEDVCEAICIGLAHLKASGALPELSEARRLHSNSKEK